MASSIIIPWIFFIQILAISSKILAAVPAIFGFGDSSIDSGNNNYIPTLARCNFEPYGSDFPGGTPTGRFCNGRLPPDFISESFGLKPIIPAYLDPTFNISDFATGVCFGSAATGYDNCTADIMVIQWTYIPLKALTLWLTMYLTESDSFMERSGILQGVPNQTTSLSWWWKGERGNLRGLIYYKRRDQWFPHKLL